MVIAKLNQILIKMFNILLNNRLFNILLDIFFLVFNKLMLTIRKRLEKPIFESHRPGMTILLFLILSIMYGLLENIASLQLIFILTSFVYLFILFGYVWWITKLNNSRIE